MKTKKPKPVDNQDMQFSFYPLTYDRWKEFEILFGSNGACGGCWCMSWRLSSSEFNKNKGEGNKKLLKSLVKSGEHVGIIAYAGGEPVGWCAFAPREKYTRLENSRVLKKLDDKPVWSISCFFISKNFRRKGLSSLLLKEVINYCRTTFSGEVQILEGYPSEPYSDNIPAAFAWTGLPAAFKKAGFKEAARRSKSRPIMRYKIKDKDAVKKI